MDCKLCGKPNKKGADSKIPCELCKEIYPEAKHCCSCGRIFPDSSRFSDGGEKCSSCLLRSAKKRAGIQKKPLEKVKKKYIQLKLDNLVIGKIRIE